MTTANIFAEAVRDFARAVQDNFSQHVDAQPEDQLKPLVGDLIKRVGAAYTNDAVSYRTEVLPDDVGGRPDLGITVGKLLMGHIELKSPGTGVWPKQFTGRNRKQWQRFQALPNLDLHQRLGVEPIPLRRTVAPGRNRERHHRGHFRTPSGKPH